MMLKVPYQLWVTAVVDTETKTVRRVVLRRNSISSVNNPNIPNADGLFPIFGDDQRPVSDALRDEVIQIAESAEWPEWRLPFLLRTFDQRLLARLGETASDRHSNNRRSVRCWRRRMKVLGAILVNESVTFGDGTFTVKSTCGSGGGRWACANHREMFQNNMEKDAHIYDGVHVLVWICAEHGPEVP
jgi:hypothetical protein